MNHKETLDKIMNDNLDFQNKICGVLMESLAKFPAVESADSLK